MISFRRTFFICVVLLVLVDTGGATTTTIYADYNAHLSQSGSNVPFSTIRNGAGDYAADLGATVCYVVWNGNAAGGTYSYEYRCGISYDTSGLPDDAIIDSVVSTVVSKNTTAIGLDNLSIVDFTPANASAFVKGDFDATTFTRLAEDGITINSADQVHQPFNPVGISKINKTGRTTLMFVLAHTVDNTPYVSGSGSTEKNIRSVAMTDPPVLTIKYHIPGEVPDFITVFNQNYSVYGSIPNNIAIAAEGPPYQSNIQTGYISNTGVWAKWTNTTSTGRVLVGGLTPAVNTTYDVYVNFTGKNFNSVVYISSGSVYVAIQDLVASGIKVYQYDNATNSTSFTAPYSSYVKPLHLTIQFNGHTKTYKTTLETYITPEQYNLTTNLMSESGLPYDAVSSNMMAFAGSPNALDNNLTVVLTAINQTIPKTGNVSAIGDASLVSFGIDGPHPVGNWENSATTVNTAGGKYTIWADHGYLTAGNLANVTPLLAKGYELGMHIPFSLTSNATPNTAIDEEVAIITSTFGRPPTSWCSLGNADNITHAIYAYNTYGMIWRNGHMGIDEFSNVGNLDNDTWPWWNNATLTGLTVRSFTHETNKEPAAQYSIDTSKFNLFVNRYSAKGMKIVPFINWYKTGANTNGSTFTENTFLSGEVENFTAHTNGYPARVYTDIIDSGYQVYNITGDAVEPHSSLNNKITFYVSDGMSYVINESTDTRTHPQIFNWYCPAGRFCLGPFILWDIAPMALA